MSETEILELLRVLAVIGLVVIAAVLTTPPNKVPLALRGLAKMLGKSAESDKSMPAVVPAYKKILAFVLVILAFIIAKI